MEANQLSAKDLKIGNYVNYFGMHLPVYSIIFPQPMEDERFSGKWIVEIFDGASTINCVIDDLKPIPLSEDVLLKLGFEKKSWKSQGIVIECFYYEKKGVIVYLIQKGFEIEVKHNEGHFNMFRVWNYVHQLQNIFYLLTGEELTFKN